MNLCLRSIFQTREPGDPIGPSGGFGNAEGGQRTSDEGKADVNADGRSDDFVLPTTRTNKAATAVAESVEERKSPKGSITACRRCSRLRAGPNITRNDPMIATGNAISIARSSDLTEEPYELNAHVRICAGGGQQ